MNLVKDWVRDLVVLVIFASIIEMLLPSSSLKKYVKIVMGFFILLAVLNPILTLVQADFRSFYPFNEVPGQKREQAAIQREGERLKAENEELAVAAFQDQLAKQVQALILTQPEVSDAKVEVKASKNGQVEAIAISLTLAEEGPNSTKAVSTVKAVEKVEINIGGKKQAAKSASEPDDPRLGRVKDKITKLMMSFYNIKEEAISFL